MKIALLPTIVLERANRRAKFQAQLNQLALSQEKLARRVGLDPSSISRYKKGGDNSKGGRQPSLDTLRALAKQGIDVVDLFGIKTDFDVLKKRGVDRPNPEEGSSNAPIEVPEFTEES